MSCGVQTLAQAEPSGVRAATLIFTFEFPIYAAEVAKVFADEAEKRGEVKFSDGVGLQARNLACNERQPWERSHFRNGASFRCLSCRNAVGWPGMRSAVTPTRASRIGVILSLSC
jgi:hypothetical protein